MWEQLFNLRCAHCLVTMNSFKLFIARTAYICIDICCFAFGDEGRSEIFRCTGSGWFTKQTTALAKNNYNRLQRRTLSTLFRLNSYVIHGPFYLLLPSSRIPWLLLWLGGVTVRASDLRSGGREFNSRSDRYQAT